MRLAFINKPQAHVDENLLTPGARLHSQVGQPRYSVLLAGSEQKMWESFIYADFTRIMFPYSLLRISRVIEMGGFHESLISSYGLQSPPGTPWGMLSFEDSSVVEMLRLLALLIMNHARFL